MKAASVLMLAAVLVACSAPAESRSVRDKWSGGTLASIGDSFASGVGATGMQLECGRSDKGWPGLLAQDLDMEYVNASCSGTTAREALEQIDDLPLDVDLIAVNTGGNTMGFVEILMRCQLGQCAAARETVDVRLPVLRSEVHELLTSLHAARPSVRRILLMTYPTATVPGDLCGGMSADSSQAFSEQWRLNQVFADVVSAVTAAGVPVVLVEHASFDGHEICSKDPWLFGFDDGLLVMHPNDAGHRALAEAAAKVLTTEG